MLSFRLIQHFLNPTHLAAGIIAGSVGTLGFCYGLVGGIAGPFRVGGLSAEVAFAYVILCLTEIVDSFVVVVFCLVVVVFSLLEILLCFAK